MTVYIVYSTFLRMPDTVRIEKVFRDKEKAERYCRESRNGLLAGEYYIVEGEVSE